MLARRKQPVPRVIFTCDWEIFRPRAEDCWSPIEARIGLPAHLPYFMVPSCWKESINLGRHFISI